MDGIEHADPTLAGLPERTFVIRDQYAPASERVDKRIPMDLSINYVPTTVTFPNYAPAVIQTEPAQQELWRVANTTSETILDLQYVVNGTPQPVRFVGIDGFPVVYGSSAQGAASETSVLLPPASRAEFVVRTPNAAAQAQLVTQYWNTGPRGDHDPARPLADIVSKAGGESGSGAFITRRLPTLTKQDAANHPALPGSTKAPSMVRKLYFSEVARNAEDPNSPTNYFITVEGQKPAIFRMDQEPNIVVHAGTVEDWIV